MLVNKFTDRYEAKTSQRSKDFEQGVVDRLDFEAKKLEQIILASSSALEKEINMVSMQQIRDHESTKKITKDYVANRDRLE